MQNDNRTFTAKSIKKINTVSLSCSSLFSASSSPFFSEKQAKKKRSSTKLLAEKKTNSQIRRKRRRKKAAQDFQRGKKQKNGRQSNKHSVVFSLVIIGSLLPICHPSLHALPPTTRLLLLLMLLLLFAPAHFFLQPPVSSSICRLSPHIFRPHFNFQSLHWHAFCCGFRLLLIFPPLFFVSCRENIKCNRKRKRKKMKIFSPERETGKIIKINERMNE